MGGDSQISDSGSSADSGSEIFNTFRLSGAPEGDKASGTQASQQASGSDNTAGAQTPQSINLANMRARGGNPHFYSDYVQENRNIVSGAGYLPTPNKIIEAPWLGKPGALGEKTNGQWEGTLLSEQSKERAGMDSGAPISDHFKVAGATAAVASLFRGPIADVLTRLGQPATMELREATIPWYGKAWSYFGRGVGAAIVYQLANDLGDYVTSGGKNDHKNNFGTYAGYGFVSLLTTPYMKPLYNKWGGPVKAELMGAAGKTVATASVLGMLDRMDGLTAPGDIGVHGQGWHSHIPESVAVGSIWAMPLPTSYKWGLTAAVFAGSRIADAALNNWSPNDIRNNVRTNLIPDDQKHRTEASLTKAIDEYKKYGLPQNDMFHHGSSMDDILGQDVNSCLDPRKQDIGVYKDNDITFSRGLATVGIAAGESRMEMGTLLPKKKMSDDEEPPTYILKPNRNDKKDYMDFGGEALWMLTKGYEGLRGAQDATNKAIGTSLYGKVVDSQEISDLKSIEPRVKGDLEQILQRNLDGSKSSFTGHDVYGALQELTHKDDQSLGQKLNDVGAAIKSLFTGEHIVTQDELGPGSPIIKNVSSLQQKMIDQVTKARQSNNPLASLYAAKLDRDLALLSFAMEIRNPAPGSGADFKKALNEYLADAESRDPDNPDNVKLRTIASTMAGANSDTPADLKWLADRISSQSPEFRQVWDAYAQGAPKTAQAVGSIYDYQAQAPVQSQQKPADTTQTTVANQQSGDGTQTVPQQLNYSPITYDQNKVVPGERQNNTPSPEALQYEQMRQQLAQMQAQQNQALNAQRQQQDIQQGNVAAEQQAAIQQQMQWAQQQAMASGQGLAQQQRQLQMQEMRNRSYNNYYQQMAGQQPAYMQQALDQQVMAPQVNLQQTFNQANASGLQQEMYMQQALQQANLQYAQEQDAMQRQRLQQQF